VETLGPDTTSREERAVIVALHFVARPVSSLKNLVRSSSKKEPLENINGCSELDQSFDITPMMIAVFFVTCDQKWILIAYVVH
jgi:hypothetical protein